MKMIPLNNGMDVKVSDGDYKWLTTFKWSAFNNKVWEAVSHFWDSKDGRAKRIRMHRLIADCPDGMVVDHINGDRLDNRRCNLRVCTVSENNRNRQKPLGGSSCFKGVSKCSRGGAKPWRASITADGKSFNLGRYTTEREAAKAYDTAANQKHGLFARTNGPLPPPPPHDS